MKLPRETTATRVRRGAITLVALAASLSVTAGAPTAMRRAAETQRAQTSPDIPVTVAAGGERIVPPAAETGVAEPVDPLPSSLPASDPLTDEPAEAPFGIDLPDGWSGGEVFEFQDDAARSFVYQDEDGRMFVVNLDPDGGGFSADIVWRYATRGDRFVVETTTTCAEGEAMCDMGNGSLLGYAIWTGGGSATVGAHAYYFRFEDPNDEGAPTGVFRRILQSIRVHD